MSQRVHNRAFKNAIAWPVLIALACAACLPASASGEVPSDAELIATIDEMAAEALGQPGGVGLSVAVARHGEIILAKGYGLAEVEHEVPATAETPFRIGSVTKQFTAAAVMRLVEQGKLSLDDELGEFLPDFPTGGKTITVHHLLTHTSGIKSYTGVEDFWETGAARDLSVEDLLAYVKDEPLEFEPGAQFAYNNTAYYMLGSVIEAASGTPYCEYLQAEFFEPLGLERTRCDSNAAIIPGRAQGYRIVEGELANDRLIGMDNPGAAGMLISTAADLVRWSEALMRGEILSAESLEMMTTPYTLNDGNRTDYGFGLGIGELEGHRRIAHGGGIFGFNAMLAWYPDDELTTAVISNGAVNSGTLARSISLAALGIEEAPVADLEPSAEEIARYSGTYVIQGPDMEARIFEQDGFLYLQAEGQPPVKLLYQGGGEFRASFDTNVKIVFDADPGDDSEKADRFVLFQGGMQMPGVRQTE